MCVLYIPLFIIVCLLPFCSHGYLKFVCVVIQTELFVAIHIYFGYNPKENNFVVKLIEKFCSAVEFTENLL